MQVNTVTTDLFMKCSSFPTSLRRRLNGFLSFRTRLAGDRIALVVNEYYFLSDIQ